MHTVTVAWNTAAKYLAVIVYDQIGEHLSAANEAMTFFKHCFGLVEAGQHLR